MASLQKPLHTEIPGKLAEIKVAFSVAAFAFERDLPASIFHLQLITKDIADSKAKGQVIAVFHTNAGHVTLNDDAYNAERMVATGNPYKELVFDLIKRGVAMSCVAQPRQFTSGEMQTCFLESRSNTDAVTKMSRLAQEGFLEITEWDRWQPR